MHTLPDGSRVSEAFLTLMEQFDGLADQPLQHPPARSTFGYPSWNEVGRLCNRSDAEWRAHFIDDRLPCPCRIRRLPCADGRSEDPERRSTLILQPQEICGSALMLADETVASPGMPCYQCFP